jgi:hypothetical protein
MSDGAFEPEKYQDDHRLRVLARIDEKVKGREITAAPQPVAKPGPVIDLMEALRESMKKPPRRKPLQLHGRGERKPNTSAFSLSFYSRECRQKWSRGPCHTQDFGIDLPLHHSLRAPRFIGVIFANPAMVTIAF